MADRELLKSLPSVDEVLRSSEAGQWLGRYPRKYVLEAIRRTIQKRRKKILKSSGADTSFRGMVEEIEKAIEDLASYSLRKVINATGIVIHTNLGRSPLSHSALENVIDVASGYSTLEYEIREGRRGKRYSHIKRLLCDVTGAEDGIAVNNNAGAVLLSLAALARGGEAIVSRGELIEIGGSFRIPDVMAESGAVLREVGTTNKTHIADYENAINDNTALILKVHQSNYRIAGFTKDVPVEELVGLGRSRNIPVMYDLGSGSLMDLVPFGIHGEPTVRDEVGKGADILTFSGDKLLGGPQAGIIVGRKPCIELLQKQPLLRALRIDKLTLAALEATLMQYIDPDRATTGIPTLRMLTETPESVRKRARKLSGLLNKDPVKGAEISVVEDVAFAGGGSLPEHSIRTFAVSVNSKRLSPNRLEERLRRGSPPVIARIKEGTLLLDARTVEEDMIRPLAECVRAALKGR
jgi:L-seryl-tRNA(Ser) seleniumtransferase